MQLKPEALNALKLPVKVKAGFLGSVKLKVSHVCAGHISMCKNNEGALFEVLFLSGRCLGVS